MGICAVCVLTSHSGARNCELVYASTRLRAQEVWPWQLSDMPVGHMSPILQAPSLEGNPQLSP